MGKEDDFGLLTVLSIGFKSPVHKLLYMVFLMLVCMVSLVTAMNAIMTAPSSISNNAMSKQTNWKNNYVKLYSVSKFIRCSPTFVPTKVDEQCILALALSYVYTARQHSPKILVLWNERWQTLASYVFLPLPE